MEYQEAIVILKGLLDKHPLDAKEKEAVMTAIGMLGWGALARSKMKAQGARERANREKSTEW